jgi:hypothetical protein
VHLAGSALSPVSQRSHSAFQVIHIQLDRIENLHRLPTLSLVTRFGFCIMEGTKWKVTALLTWLIAAEKAHCFPRVETAVGSILQSTTAHSAISFETQYPPSNSEHRLLIPESHPVRRLIERDFMIYGKMLTIGTGISSSFGTRRPFITAAFSQIRRCRIYRRLRRFVKFGQYGCPIVYYYSWICGTHSADSARYYCRPR